MANSSLQKAKTAKNDEFYTQLTDIEKELHHYKHHFEGKIVFCNCDDPEWSNFWRYFQLNFYHLGLKKLISTHYEPGTTSYKLEIVASEDKNGQIGIPDYIKTPLEGDGDFRSEECVEILKEADIVVTNPPFSLFREYVAQLVEHSKKFIIIGNPNAITYKEVFPLLKNNKMWIGHKSMGTDMLFDVSKEYAEELVKTKKEGSGYKIIGGVIKGRAAAIWFTNLDLDKRHQELILYKNYTPEEYPKYDNYDAINVDKVSEIPCDYVPCWFNCVGAKSCEYAKNSGFNGQALCDIIRENNAVAEPDQTRPDQTRPDQTRPDQTRRFALLRRTNKLVA